jgi:hypothetical protein
VEAVLELIINSITMYLKAVLVAEAMGLSITRTMVTMELAAAVAGLLVILTLFLEMITRTIAIKLVPLEEMV